MPALAGMTFLTDLVEIATAQKRGVLILLHSKYIQKYSNIHFLEHFSEIPANIFMI